MSITIRPVILPWCISSKMAGASSSVRSCTLGTTKPSAPNWNASSKSLRVPTSEPTTSMPSNTTRGIDKSMLSGGKPIATTRPPARTQSTAELNAALDTAVTTAACAPPLVCFLMNSAASSLLGFTTKSAPLSLANANFSSFTSTAITCAPNTFFAYCTPKLPKPPAP